VAPAFRAIAVEEEVNPVAVIETFPEIFEAWSKVTLLAEETVKAPSGERPPAPTIPLKVISPVPAVKLKVLEFPDPRVESKSIVPGPEPVLIAILPERVVALLKLTSAPVVKISPAVTMPVAPVSSMVPPEVISPAERMLS
jgi:hypothetical protein